MKQRPTSAPLLSAASSSLRRRRARGEDTTGEDIQRFESFAHDIKRCAQASGVASKTPLQPHHAVGEADDGETHEGTPASFPVEPQPWVRPTVGSQPGTDDHQLQRLSSLILRRRAVRTSYPPEANQFEAFAQQGECEQRHRLVYAFREKDVLPPDETSMLDSKDAVRDLLAKYEDRRAFKSNAETDLGAWVATLPGQAQDFGNLVNARDYELELEQMEEQQMGSVIRNETDKMDAAMHHLYDFGGKMFDDLHNAVDRQEVQLEREARERQRRRPRDAATTTDVIVPIAAEDLTGTELSQMVPFGCGVIPEETLMNQVISRDVLRLDLGDAPFRSQSVNGGAAVSSTSSDPLSPSAAGSPSPAGVREEVDALRNVASRLAHQRESEAQRFRERLNALQAENARLQQVVADNRRDVQRTLQEESGVEVSWEEVNNGRSAAQFLADALPMVTEAIAAKMSREVEFSVHSKVRAAAQIEIDEAKAATAQVRKQLAELNKQLRTAIDDKESELKFHVELQQKLSVNLDCARQELTQTTGLWTQASRELGEWKSKALALEKRLRTIEDQLESANVQIAASKAEAQERVLLAQRMADQQIRKGAEAVSHETKRLQQEVEDGLQQRLRVEAELALAKHSSQQKIASLEHALQEARTAAIDTRVVERFVEGIVSSLFGNLLLAAKTLRQSALKDNLATLRTSCAEACTATVKRLKDSLAEHRNFFLLLSHDARESVSRSEKMCGWELDELAQASWNTSDPTEVALHAAKKDAGALRDALQVAKDAAARQAALTAAVEARLTSQTAAAAALVQHLNAAVRSLCTEGALSPCLHSWSPSPPDIPSEVAEESWWTSALPASLGVYRHIKQYVLQREEEQHRLLSAIAPAPSSREPENQAAAVVAADLALASCSSISLENGDFAANFNDRIQAVLDQVAPTVLDGSSSRCISGHSVLLGALVPLKNVLRTLVQALTRSLIHALESSATALLEETVKCVDSIRSAAERVDTAWLRCARGLCAVGLVKKSFQRRMTKLQDSVHLLSDACERAFSSAKVDAIRLPTDEASGLSMEQAVAAKRVLVARCNRELTNVERDLRASLHAAEQRMAHHVAVLVQVTAEVPANLDSTWEQLRRAEASRAREVDSLVRTECESQGCQTEQADAANSFLPLERPEPSQHSTCVQTVSPCDLVAFACCEAQTDEASTQHQSTETDPTPQESLPAEEHVGAVPPAAPTVLTTVSTQTDLIAPGEGAPLEIETLVDFLTPLPQRGVVSSVHCQTTEDHFGYAPLDVSNAADDRRSQPPQVAPPNFSAVTLSPEASLAAASAAHAAIHLRPSTGSSDVALHDSIPGEPTAEEPLTLLPTSSVDNQLTKFAKAKGLVRPSSATVMAVSGQRLALSRPHFALRRAESSPTSCKPPPVVSSTACMTDMELLVPYIVTLSRAVTVPLPAEASTIASPASLPSRMSAASIVITTRQKQTPLSTPATRNSQPRW